MTTRRRWRSATVLALSGWLLLVWLIAVDRAATASDAWGSASPWRIMDVMENGVLVGGPNGLTAYSVLNGNLTKAGGASLPAWRKTGFTDPRCLASTCSGIVLSAESGLEIDASQPTFVRSHAVRSTEVGSVRSRVGVAHADHADRFVALLADVGATPRLVEVNGKSSRVLGAGGGLGLRTVTSPRGSALAVVTGEGDGDVGLPAMVTTHWLARVGSDWTVTSTDAALPVCIADDGSAVAVDGDEPGLRRPDRVVHSLPAVPASDPRVFRPCVVGRAGTLLVVYESEEQILVRTGGRTPASRFALVWTSPTGETEAIVRLDARWVSPSPDRAHVAAVNRDDEVVVFDRNGTKKTVATNAAAAEFLGNGQLVVVDQRGRARLVPAEQWR